eukprot:TRINITY_DN11709_c0_g2_i6.p1 TRINITY_DN11709_c0_g2~~TRINITY_DN11709_c0_g2_i6.p1  ORF type:complete len:248 (-),score=42.58 TRINITY_DN11709_c0_g2_i6:115-858(-)
MIQMRQEPYQFMLKKFKCELSKEISLTIKTEKEIEGVLKRDEEILVPGEKDFITYYYDFHLRCQVAAGLPHLLQSSKSGYFFGTVMLSRIYDISEVVGVGPSDTQKSHFYLQSADQSWNDSFLKTTKIYELCLLGIYFYLKKDFIRSFQYLQLAADKNDPVSQSSIGQMYLNGNGVVRNYAEALRYCQLASNQGYWGGQYNVAGIYENGLGVAIDKEKAMYYYQLSANQGFSLSQEKINKKENCSIL